MNFDLTEAIRNVLLFMPAFLFALVVHEFAHAWMATKFGDNTSEWSGRLTMNPMAHIDPIGTILLPIISIASGLHIFFGWAKPVPIDPRQFSSYRKGLFWVSFAGPLSNIITGFVAALLFVGFGRFVSQDFGFYKEVLTMLQAFLILNFSLAVFNLIPIPPLDGSNILLSFLSHNAAQKYAQFSQYSGMLLLFLVFSGALRVISIPVMLLAELSVNLANSVFAFA